MRGHTHALIGLTTVAAVERLTGFVQAHPVAGLGLSGGWALCAAAGVLGALAPDIDAEDSAIKRELGLAGRAVSGGLHLLGVQHRGLTHRGVVALAVLAVGLVLGRSAGYPDVGLAFGLGYLSHLLADGLTKTGIPLLWPLPGRVHLLPPGLRIRTGGVGELLVFVLVAGLLAWLGPQVVPPDWLRFFNFEF